MLQQLQILHRQRQLKGVPFETPTRELLSNTAFSIFHIPSLSLPFDQTSCTLVTGSMLSCVSMCTSVVKRWRGTERLCEKVMLIAAVMCERVAWMFCFALMHLFDGSACFIRISSHICFHGLSCCCSVGKF